MPLTLKKLINYADRWSINVYYECSLVHSQLIEQLHVRTPIFFSISLQLLPAINILNRLHHKIYTFYIWFVGQASPNNFCRLSLLGISFDSNQTAIEKPMVILAIIASLVGLGWGTYYLSNKLNAYATHMYLSWLGKSADHHEQAMGTIVDKDIIDSILKMAAKPNLPQQNKITYVYTDNGLCVVWPRFTSNADWTSLATKTPETCSHFKYYLNSITTIDGQITYKLRQALFNYKYGLSKSLNEDSPWIFKKVPLPDLKDCILNPPVPHGGRCIVPQWRPKPNVCEYYDSLEYMARLTQVVVDLPPLPPM